MRKKTKTLRAQINFDLTIPEDIPEEKLPKVIKENFFLYSGKDQLYLAGDDSNVPVRYSAFVVRLNKEG